MNKPKEIWIDSIKVLACVLVALGHFFQSMVTSEILPETDLYRWFNETIYYFHVPLFFICSGYLYQKKTCVNSISSWKVNVIKKGITLGIPYFAFSIVTWVMKEVFSGQVNMQNSGLLKTLFLAPASPYWYLYALFFVFLITPTFSNKQMALYGLSGALVFKVISMYFGGTGVYAISTILANEIWFVLGMVLAAFDIVAEFRTKRWMYIGIALAVVFLVSSVWVYQASINIKATPLLMGMFGCVPVVLIMVYLFPDRKQRKPFGFLAKYTMPIFLMHTIFAAGLRSVLLKIGVTSIAIHVILGLSISFVGPILAAEIMKRVKWMEFFLYPGKYIKMAKLTRRQYDV